MRRTLAFGSILFVACLVSRAATLRERPMSTAASAFLTSLASPQIARAALPANHGSRFAWHVEAREPFGLPLVSLTPAQRRQFDALLATALSDQGIERVAAALELDVSDHALAFFGDPNADAPWSWRLEGFHLSLNFSVTPSVDGATETWSSTPFFLGADPARVASGEREGFELLGEEARLARELVQSLGEAERVRAIRGDLPPDDLLFGPDRERVPVFRPGGLRAQLMDDDQRALLRRLIAATLDDLLPGDAEARGDFEGEAFDGVHFLWMGEPDAERFYYRVQGDAALIEFVVVGENHVHLACRDRGRDFGGR